MHITILCVWPLFCTLQVPPPAPDAGGLGDQEGAELGDFEGADGNDPNGTFGMSPRNASTSGLGGVSTKRSTSMFAGAQTMDRRATFSNAAKVQDSDHKTVTSFMTHVGDFIMSLLGTQQKIIGTNKRLLLRSYNAQLWLTWPFSVWTVFLVVS